MNLTPAYYPSGEQVINIDPETGARFWSVAGNNLQFTWFEVFPKSVFKEHSHDSEQVTHVLSGDLFFKIDDVIYKLSPGDSIVIPGNKKHTVWTETSAAIAVDAWWPVNQKFHSLKK